MIVSANHMNTIKECNTGRMNFWYSGNNFLDRRPPLWQLTNHGCIVSKQTSK
jgi:hypothetical protein